MFYHSVTEKTTYEYEKCNTTEKRALITGITGQDGSYLAEFLLKKGYKVGGILRCSSTDSNLSRITHIQDKLKLFTADLLDMASLIKVIEEFEPDEIYNLAAQSFVPASWVQPIYTSEVTALGVTNILESIRIIDDKIRFYQASSSEMFGKVQETPQTEKTPFYPRSPYGVSKVYGHWMTVNYRESYGMHASSGILFNHEGTRRGHEFVTRKITDGVARIKLGLMDKLLLGNLDAKRDWGYAKDYVKAMWSMLQQDGPTDYVIATGKTHSVRDFVKKAFECVDLDYTKFVEQDPRFVRPAEVDLLIGNATKARKKLGWRPTTGFDDLVELMVFYDLSMLKNSTEKR